MSEGCLIYGAMQHALEYTNKPWIRKSFFCQSFLLPKFFTAKVFYHMVCWVFANQITFDVRMKRQFIALYVATYVCMYVHKCIT